MYFPYGLWRDAGRDARRLPPSDNNGCGTLVMIVLGFMIVSACFSAGGLGILFGVAVIVGILKGMNE
jgi:hypothetical protein